MNAERAPTRIIQPESEKVPLYRFWQPRYWPLWISLLVLRILVMLPIRQQRFIGRWLGRAGLRLVPKRRRIAAANLAICFPELDQKAREKLLERHFESLAHGMLELGMSLWAGNARLEKLIDIDGVENIRKPLDAGRNVIILSGHFAVMELTGRLVPGYIGDVAAMYRTTRNPFVDQILWRGRNRSTRWLIPKDGLRQMIKTIKQGIPTWYASDQAYNRKYHVLVPFFGEPAMTNAALTHIAKMTDAVVVPYIPRRLDNNRFAAEFLPALDHFPTNDPAADALRINQLLEEQIRIAPEQYYWVHRRFKDRPDPYPDPYAHHTR